MDQSDPVIMLTIEEFKTSVVIPWVNLTRDINTSKGALKTLEQQKKDYEKQMMAWMEAKGASKIKTPLGDVAVIDSKQTSALNKDYLLTQFTSQGMSEVEAKKLIEEIYDNRTTKQKRKLSLVKAGKRQKTDQ